MILGWVATVSFGQAAIPADHRPAARDAAVIASAEEFKRTVVTPHMQCPVGAGTNVLWCATFQLAWDQLCNASGGPVQLEPDHGAFAVLNAAPFNTNDLDAASFVAIAGFGPPTLGRIKDALQSRFGEDVLRRAGLPPAVADDEWMAYSYLFKELSFKVAFARMRGPLTFAGAAVASFGVDQYNPDRENNQAQMGRQVLLFDYRGEHDFIVGLVPDSAADRIILAQIPPASNMATLVGTVGMRIGRSRATRMSEMSRLQVPVVDLDLVKTYAEFQQARISAKDTRVNGTRIAMARQWIRFRLDEKGALLISQNWIAMGRGEDLVFDRPFLVLLQKRGAATPYFALWVANAELLAPFAGPPR